MVKFKEQGIHPCALKLKRVSTHRRLETQRELRIGVKNLLLLYSVRIPELILTTQVFSLQ